METQFKSLARLAVAIILAFAVSGCPGPEDPPVTPPASAPSTPSGVSATAGNSQVTVSWTAVSGATSYDIYWSNTTGVTTANGTKAAGATSGGAVTGLTNGTTYYFVVTAVNSAGESPASSEASASPSATALNGVTGVSATAGNSQVTVSWTAVTGATSYNVYYSTTSGVTTVNGIKVTGATSGGAITGLANGTAYYFVVTAVNAAGESAASSEVSATPASTPPSAPTGVSATAASGQVTVSWTAVTGATSYNVYYRTTAGVTTVNGIKVTGATSGGAITGLANGTAYYFVVTAVNAAGESAASSEASASPTGGTSTPPSAPTGVSATAASGQVTVSWTAVTGATSYNVYYRTTAGVTTANGTKVVGATSGGAITGLTNGTTYYFVVTAANTAGESTASSQVSTSPSANALNGVTGVSATAGNGQVTVSWTAVTGATSYNIYWSTTTGVTTTSGMKITGATSPYTHTGLTNGTKYYYIVTAANAVGESAASSQASATPTNFIGGAIQKQLTLAGTVSTYVGSAGFAGSSDGPGWSTARFYGPYGITTDGTNLFVTDNNTIRQVVIATGAVTTIAGSAGIVGSTDGTGTAARFNNPTGITTDGTNLYVMDTNNYTIRKVVIATGAVTTLAGSAGVTGSTDGTGSAARFGGFWGGPRGISISGGYLYVADTGNCTIRTVVIATAAVTTLAGNAVSGAGSTNGTGTAARFGFPAGITTDGTNLYVADTSNWNIRKVVIATGVVTTLAGSLTGNQGGSTDGTGTAARFLDLNGITTDGTNLYVADTNNWTIRQVVIASGVVTTLAGSAAAPGSTDSPEAARFNMPMGITTFNGNLYVAEKYKSTIRQVVIANSAVTTLAGTAGVPGSTDGAGSARFYFPASITTDGTNLYVSDNGNDIMRKVVITTGSVTTFAGTAGVMGSADGTGSAARFTHPNGITTDGTNLYVADSSNETIRKVVMATGAVTTIAGTAGVRGTTDGTGSAALFDFPFGITTDGTNLYVTDKNNSTIRQVVIASGVVTTLAGTAGIPGATDSTGSAARFSSPYGITTDGLNLYVADGNSTIRKVVIATGVVTTIAGSAGLNGATDGTGSAARFTQPQGITTDGTNLYVADTYNSTIRKVVIATGTVTTIAGSGGLNGATNGTGSAARFYYPADITTDGTSLYVVDRDSNTIRKIQ